MNLVSFLGAIEIGFVYGLVALGVYLSFRILNFPDLTVDGSFPLGAAVSAALIVSGVDPYLATACAVLAGMAAGLVTAVLNLRFGILHLLPALPDFFARYPEVTLEIDLNDRFVNMIDEGFDLALRIGDLEDSSLIGRRLAANRRVLAAAPSYLAGRAAPRRPEDLTGHDCLIYTYRAQRHDWHLVDDAGEECIVSVGGSLETNNPMMLRAAALSGLGVVLLPLWIIGPDLKAGRLERILPSHHWPDSAIHAVYPPGRHLSAKVRHFVDFLVERFAD